MSHAPASPSSSTCITPTCPPSSPICSPACKDKSVCRLSVIESTCQCPVASCVTLDFDTGAGNSNTPIGPSTPQSSVVGPVIGSIAALGAVAIIAFFVVRRRKQRRRHELMMMCEDDSLDSFSKRWHSTNSIDSSGKDVIQIAYIPSVIGETPVMSPEPTMQHGGVLKPNFTSLKDEERNKHDSVSSLDEAVVMAVTTKATPQVMKLNAIKATQSDLIQRSNTLHSSNSVKRSKSQRKLANKDRNPSPLASAQPEDGPDNDSDMESPSEDDEGNPFMTEAELATATNVSSYTNDTHDSSVTRAPSPYSNNPFLSLAETKAMSHVTSPPGTPMSETTVFASVPISLEDQQYDPLADLAGGGVRLRPWATSGPTAMRDSTFSTMSDGRSTRGDGEEIMIFWDGSRDSRSNL